MPDPYPKGGAHRDVQKHNLPLNKKGEKRESNHVPPKSVYVGPYATWKEDDMPAHSIRYDDHRVGKGRAGDGATSTGSSDISKEYRKVMMTLMAAGKFADAMIYDIRDLQNTHGIEFTYYNDGLAEAATYALSVGLLTSDYEYHAVLNQIYGR